MDDHARVAELLGRQPAGAFDVVVRDDHGDPVVVRNAPFLDGGLTRGLSRADLAVASGCCQDCGAEVLARDV